MKKFLFKTAILSIPFFANYAYAEDFGCKAVLCFAGGQGVSECQPTIKKVLRDMAKGKSFPHCSFVGYDGKTENNAISVNNTWTKGNSSSRCPDGETRPILGNYCRTLIVNVKGEYAKDNQHKTQYYYY